MPNKIDMLGLWDWPVMRFLRRDRKRAERIIGKAFPGYSLRKTRKDAGKKKGEKNEHIQESN